MNNSPMPRHAPLSRRDFMRVSAGAAVVGAFAGRATHAASLVLGTPTDELNALYAGQQLYWGDIHTHTGFSDGYGTPAMAFDEARRLRGLHFAAVTDHAEWIRYFEDRLRMANGQPAPLWAGTLADADDANDPGAFVTLPAFEWTNDRYGHRHILFRSSEDVPIRPISAVSHPTPHDMWAALEPHAAMTIPHHPTRWGKLMDWTHYHPRIDRLVEIYSKWGNAASVWTPYELPTAYRRNPILRGAAEASGVDAMLARSGHRIGILAGSDSHQGMLGSLAADRPRGRRLPRAQYPKTAEQFFDLLEQGFTFDLREPQGGGGGICAVWAPRLTRESVWDALYQRRTYGTTGTRAAIRFAAREAQNGGNAALMGEDVSMQGPPRLLVSAVADAFSRVTEVRVMNTNKVLKSWSRPARGAALSFDDLNLPVGQTACYRCLILVQQEARGNFDGDLKLGYDPNRDRFHTIAQLQRSEQVWTSPIWVTRRA